MHQNPNSFSMDDALRLASTPAGKELVNLLKANTSQEMDYARKAVESGDYETAKNSLSSLLRSPDIQKLLQQLESSHE